jgi:cathepsin L
MPAVHAEFASFKATFNKTYDTPMEEISRLRIFEANLQKIAEHNSNPRWTYTLGVNQYADMTSSEFAAIYAKGKMWDSASAVDELDSHDGASDVPVSELPDSVDWRTKNVVTAPKNQGGCGSCWAFSTAETLESHIAIKTGKLLTLSPQEYVSCSPNPDHCGGTGGCQGSTQILGFKYAISAGITSEADYPYEGSTGTCDKSKIKPVAKITGYVKLPTNNYTALMNAVVSKGPIAISAAAEPWQLYSKGIYNGDCGSDIDHAIQLVGYGTQAKEGRMLLGGGGGGGGSGDYWLVRNSWGAGWGEKGYIRIQRNGEGKEPCMTDKNPGDGFGCTGGPPSVQVCGVCGLMSESSYPTGGSLV